DDPPSLTACTSAPNDCSLRSAISIANSDGKPTTISFAGSYLIRLSHPLPSLSEDNTVIKAGSSQEVHIDGQNIRSSVLRITGAHVHVEGLRIYGAGAGYPNIAIDEGAHDVTITQNVIGDDDAPHGNCGGNNFSSSGIFVSGHQNIEHETRAWIYGNLIECNQGDGIWVLSGNVIIGKNQQGANDSSQRNVIRENHGYGINLGQTTGNTVCDNEIVTNDGRSLYMTRFQDNNIMYNDIVEISSAQSMG
ncbi:MAG: right-handed parallel beta-helix repeat-containing protein, partial [Candidatus Promineifilaceae bacterium]|nr:right-handed parallel beta-helix repeat-containing protein [Candidatus Promineifilaceae bacterium]